MADEITPEMAAVLERQVAYFSSDERIKERAAIWRDATPEERFAAMLGSCAEAEHFLKLKSPEELERALTPDPLPDDTVAILESMQAWRR